MLFKLSRTADGRLFHIFGHAEFEKLLSSNRVFFSGERHRFWCQQSEYDGQWAILDGSRRRGRPASDWNTNPASLKQIRWRSGNQCSWRDTGVMCSCRRLPVTRRAAAFLPTAVHGRSNPLEMPYSTELQSSRRQEMNVWTSVRVDSVDSDRTIGRPIPDT